MTYLLFLFRKQFNHFVLYGILSFYFLFGIVLDIIFFIEHKKIVEINETTITT